MTESKCSNKQLMETLNINQSNLEYNEEMTVSCLVFGAGQIQVILDFLSYFPLFPFISHRVSSCSFAFLRAVSRSHRAPIPYLPIIFVYLRDIFAHFSYSFVYLIPFTSSLPVTFLHIPSHFLAFLSLGLAQSV